MLTGHPPSWCEASPTSWRGILPAAAANRRAALRPDDPRHVMVSGLAADRNRRPPVALLLAEALERIADRPPDVLLHLSGPCCAGTLCRLSVHHDSRAALNWSLRSPLNSF